MAEKEANFEPMDFQEEDLAMSTSNIADRKFDITIGHIEDIIMEEEFQTLQNNFLEKYWETFEDTEENKFIYTDIHQEYIELVEKFITDQVQERMPDFSETEFAKHLIDRKDELEGEVFEMLLTFSDFLAFKEMFIDYRNSKEGRIVDLSCGFTVKPLSGSQIGASGDLQFDNLQDQ